jgi:hypothetical protein
MLAMNKSISIKFFINIKKEIENFSSLYEKLSNFKILTEKRKKNRIVHMFKRSSPLHTAAQTMMLKSR